MGRKPKITIIDERHGETTPIKEDKLPVVYSKPQMHSYLLSTASYNYSLYAQRIKYSIISQMQDRITTFMKHDFNFYHLLECAKEWAENRTSTTFVFPMKEIVAITDKDLKVKVISDALDELLKTRIKYERNDKLGEIIEGSFVFAESYEINVTQRTISVCLTKNCYLTLMNFIYGYSLYDLHIIRKFTSQYTMRLYEILYGQKNDFFLNVDEIRKMFMIEDKYQSAGDLRRKVIDIAKKEMDKLSPRTFEYECIYKKNDSPKGGRPILHTICFMPMDNPNVRYISQEQTDKMKKASIRRAKTQASNLLSYDIVNKLEEYGITREGMVNGKNAETLMKFDKLTSEEQRYHFWGVVDFKMANSVKEITNRQGFVMRQIQDLVERYERDTPEHADEEVRKFNDLDALPF